MSLSYIRKLFTIHFARVLWLRNLLHCIKLTREISYLCRHASMLLALVSVGRILLPLYVDDMIINGDDCDGIELLKANLSHRFATLFSWYRDNKIVDIPSNSKAKYTPTDGNPSHDPSLYRTIVGSLVYLIVARSNIAYVVHIVSQFVGAPTIVRWAAILQILRYL
nr:hypothetical protein [Tanacetum cinerariifolium]